MKFEMARWRYEASIRCHTRYIFEKDEKGRLISETYQLEKTYGYMDGESIDLFDLQEWFDKNREWINALKEKTKED